MPTEMKKGQQITISAENGQELTVKQLMVNDAFYQNVPLDEYFKVENSNGMLTLTATKDSNLAFSMIHLTVPFDQKDIVMNVTTPLIPNEKFKVIGDDYVQPISVLYPNSAETAWGNYNQNGAYANDTSVNVEGSTTQPVDQLRGQAFRIETVSDIAGLPLPRYSTRVKTLDKEPLAALT